jgi:hypothetical protein
MSPDLNCCEQVGGMLKHLVRSVRPVIDSRDDLINALNTAHAKMSDISWRQYFINLVDSMPRRIEAVREAVGGHTRY